MAKNPFIQYVGGPLTRAQKVRLGRLRREQERRENELENLKCELQQQRDIVERVNRVVVEFHRKPGLVRRIVLAMDPRVGFWTKAFEPSAPTPGDQP